MSYGLIVAPWITPPPSASNSPSHSPTRLHSPLFAFASSYGKSTTVKETTPYSDISLGTAWHSLPTELQCLILQYAIESSQESLHSRVQISKYGPTVWEAREIFYATQQPLARMLLVSRACANRIIPTIRRQENELQQRVDRLGEVIEIGATNLRRCLAQASPDAANNALAETDDSMKWAKVYNEVCKAAQRDIRVYKERLEALRTAKDSILKRSAQWDA